MLKDVPETKAGALDKPLEARKGLAAARAVVMVPPCIMFMAPAKAAASAAFWAWRCPAINKPPSMTNPTHPTKTGERTMKSNSVLAFRGRRRMEAYSAMGPLVNGRWALWRSHSGYKSYRQK